jgi:type 1 glutamine amidotransferase
MRVGKSLVLASVLATMLGASGADANADKIRVLLITGGHGFEETQFFALFDAIDDVTYTKAEFPAAAELLKPDAARQFDAIVFYDMWADGISPAQQRAFLALLDTGIGVVALHHTLAAHQTWPEYAKIIGGKYFIPKYAKPGDPEGKYFHDQDVPVTIADKEHPITRGLADFQIHDETYQSYFHDPGNRVLLKTNHPKSDSAIAWVRKYANSRVAYIQLGHDHHAYEHPMYRTLVARAIRWSVGRATEPGAPWTALFNGKDLAGWVEEGKAHWEVKDGVLIGRQGANNAPGDLLTDKDFGDFELKVTFRVVWPANTGVWYRYQSASKALQADILEYQNPFALTGSLYCTGKMFIALNTDPKNDRPRRLEHIRNSRRRQSARDPAERPQSRRCSRQHLRSRPDRLSGARRQSVRTNASTREGGAAACPLKSEPWPSAPVCTLCHEAICRPGTFATYEPVGVFFATKSDTIRSTYDPVSVCAATNADTVR